MPFSMDAEKGVLGSVLSDPPNRADDLLAALPEEAFYVPAHRAVYSAIEALQGIGKVVDPISLQQYLADNGLMDKVGGPSMVADLYTFVPTAAHMSFYVKIVREKWLARSLMLAGTSVVEMVGAEGSEDIEDLMERAEAEVMGVRDKSAVGEERCVSARAATLATIEAVEKAYEAAESGRMVTGIPTGIQQLDEMTAGWQPNQMVVVGARPSTGKTALGRGFVRVACQCGYPTLVFSAEMSSLQIMRAEMSAVSGLGLYRLRSGFINKNDFPRVMSAAESLQSLPMWIDDTSSPSLNYIVAKTRRMVRKHGIKLVVIDYLQLLRSTAKRGKENRNQEVSDVSAGLKSLAKDMGIPVIVLAQLNRDVEKRGDGVPKLSDIRESGSVEQDADTVILLHRPERDMEDLPVEEAWAYIAKQREGETGRVGLEFHRKTVMFTGRDSGSEDY